MGYFGCGALLQFCTISLVLIATICLARAWYADIQWKDELERIKGIFTDEEAHTLQREGHLLEVPYLFTLVGLIVAIIFQTSLCFIKQKMRFHKTRLSRLMVVIISFSLIGLSIFPALMTIYYDQKYYKVEATDTRVYTYRAHFQNGSTYNAKSHSMFFYCHLGNGRPILWSRLKGLRMKKYGSNLCQKAGLRVISSVLLIYGGILYLLTLKVLDSRRRDKNAAHVALLFDLFGDLEQSIAENPQNTDNATPPTLEENDGTERLGIRMDMEAYKRALLKSSFKSTKLPPKLEEWLRSGKYEEEQEEANEKNLIPQPNVYEVSQFPEDNAERGVPEYLSHILKVQLDIRDEVEAERRAEEIKRDAMQRRQRSWMQKLREAAISRSKRQIMPK